MDTEWKGPPRLGGESARQVNGPDTAGFNPHGGRVGPAGVTCTEDSGGRGAEGRGKVRDAG